MMIRTCCVEEVIVARRWSPAAMHLCVIVIIIITIIILIITIVIIIITRPRPTLGRLGQGGSSGG